MMLKELIFKFMDEFFLAEADGIEFKASRKAQKERWDLCEGCEYFNAIEEGCNACGCYLPPKIQDPYGDCPLDKWASSSEEWSNNHYDMIRERIIENYPEYKEVIERHERIE